MNQKLKEKITESLSSVLPVTCIVLILGITITPIPLDPLMLFLAGAAFLIIGMGFFTLGVDMAMMPIGEKVGAQLAKAKKLPVIVIACVIIGAMVTVAEPDLQVLARQTPAVPDMVLILAVAAGVGFFLALAFLRSLFGWSLSHILLVCYIILFILAFYIPGDFLAVAFDSGGVTTGPVTVPFIMALGVGLSSIGQGKNADSDSFGLVSLCSIGPILSVMILGLLFQSSSGAYEPMTIPSISNSLFSAVIAAHKAVKIAKQGIKCPVDFLFFTERLLTDIHLSLIHIYPLPGQSYAAVPAGSEGVSYD